MGVLSANPFYIGDKQYVVASIVKHAVTIGTNKGTGGKREENQKPVKFYYLTAKTEYSAKDIPCHMSQTSFCFQRVGIGFPSVEPL